MTKQFLNVSFSMSADADQQGLLAGAVEKLSAMAVGLALDGATVSLTVGPMELEPEEAKWEQRDSP
jgi:hypothetical protein